MTRNTDPQALCEAEAESKRQSLIDGIMPEADEEDRITRATVYGAERISGWSYMLGGNGPTVYAHCWGRNDDAVVIIEVNGWSERAFRSIVGPSAAVIGDRLARASRGDL